MGFAELVIGPARGPHRARAMGLPRFGPDPLAQPILRACPGHPPPFGRLKTWMPGSRPGMTKSIGPSTHKTWPDVRFTPKRPNCRAASKSRFGPCVDGSELARRIFTSQAWSVQPCVRPLSAVHMTAGHNALRGSGSGQKLAFENALARVGCPDRRIDRLCITCCSPSQPSHHATVLGAISSDPQRDWIIVSLAGGHHRPSHSGELVGERDGGDFGRPSRQ